MTRKSRREIERLVSELWSSTGSDLEVHSEVVTVTEDVVGEDVVDVPDGATVVHESDAITAYVEDGS